MSDWISVKERLPEEDFDGFYDKNGEYPTFIVMIDVGVIPATLQFNGTEWIDEDSNVYNVTHWMPLPEPPKEVRK